VRPVDWFLLGAIVLIFCPVWYLAMGEILSWAGDKAIRRFYRKERDAMEAICLCCKRIGTVNPDDIGYTCEFCGSMFEEPPPVPKALKDSPQGDKPKGGS
jgi:hypothetical protein